MASLYMREATPGNVPMAPPTSGGNIRQSSASVDTNGWFSAPAPAPRAAPGIEHSTDAIVGALQALRSDPADTARVRELFRLSTERGMRALAHVTSELISVFDP